MSSTDAPIRHHTNTTLLPGVIAVIGLCSNAFAQENAGFKPPEDVEFRAASIISEGTRQGNSLFGSSQQPCFSTR